MSSPTGSPRGTIRLWPANVTDEEINSKGGLKKSIQEELDELSDCTYTAAKNLHPFVNSNPTDTTPYLWSVYNTKLPGRFKVTVQGSILNNETPIWKFWGSAHDFLYALKHEVPMITNLLIPGNNKVIQGVAAQTIFDEGQKIGIRICEYECLDQPKEVEDRESNSKVVDTEGYGAENLKEDAMNPSTYSKLTDPGHQGFQVSLGSRFARILKIALHVLKTPLDENPEEDPNKDWSVVPDQPSGDEKEGIEYFKTRDEAAAWLKTQEESNIIGSVIKANDLSDWFEPEDAAVVAWRLRKSSN